MAVDLANAHTGSASQAQVHTPHPIAGPAYRSPATIGSLLLSALLVFTGLLLTRSPWSFTLNIGAEGPLVDGGHAATFFNLYQYHGVEQWDGDPPRTFRWTDRRAALTVPHVQRAGPLILDLTACGCRPGPLAPAGLQLNTRLSVPLPIENEWRVYRVLIPPDLPHPEYGVFIDLQPPIFRAPDGRTLGMAIDRITLRQVVPAPVAEPTGVLIVLAGALALMLTRRARLAPLLAICWLATGWLYQPQLLPPAIVSLALVAGLTGLWLLVERHLPLRRAAFIILVAAGIAIWLALSAQVLGDWIVDDAFISFHYARNLFLGNGLVFNPGERVEGYTNFLWTLLVTGMLYAGWDPVIGAHALTLLAGFALVGLTVVLARPLAGEGWAWGAGGLLAFSGPFLCYTSRGSGMETGFYAALIAASLVQLSRGAWRAGGVFTALAMLTRPDGALLAVAGAAAALAGGLVLARGSSPRAMQTLGIVAPWRSTVAARWDRRPLVRYLVPILVIYGVYFMLRWFYYGALLPNTFYAKVDASQDQALRGLRYVWEFAAGDLLLPAGLCGAALGLRLTRDAGVRRAGTLLTAYAILYTLYVVAVGGDWVPGFRFGVPLLAPCVALTVWGLAHLARSIPGLAGAFQGQGIALLLLGALAGGLMLRLPAESSFNTASGVWGQMQRVRQFRETGLWLNAHTPPDAVIAASAVGAIPYYGQRVTIDVLGLTDAHVARSPRRPVGGGLAGHERSDPDYVMARRPDIITWHAAAYLDRHPALAREYERLQFDGPEGSAVKLYVRRSDHVGRG